MTNRKAKFIGRNQEMEQLLHMLERAKKGHGGILLITGEAGIGKTRLVEELSKEEVSSNCEFLRGECIYQEGTDPYLPFNDMFKGYLSEHPYLAKAVQASLNTSAGVIFDFYQIERTRYSPISDAQETTDKSSEKNLKYSSIKKSTDGSGLYTRIPTTEPIGVESGVRAADLSDISLLEGKNRMFETISKIIINISKRKPLVLFLDDIHWADAASLHLLHYLVRNIENQPILILGAYRQEDLEYLGGHILPLQELITRLKTENLLTIIELKRLNREVTIKIVKDLLKVKKVPKDFADLIYKDTEGNPFFINEVLRTLIDDGALSVNNGQVMLNRSSNEIIIPTSIKELINLRLQRLEDEYVDVLESASIIGIEFQLDLLKNIVDLPESKLINILSKLTEMKFIMDAGKGESFTWQFTHNKIHEVIYNHVNDIKRKFIHLRLAKYLEDSCTDNIDDVVYDLAYHFYNGVDFDRALSYSIEGGEKAMVLYANKEALDFYNIGLNSLRRLDEKLANTPHYKEKKIEILSKLGILNKMMGEGDKALNYYEQLLPICDEINDLQKKSSTFLDIGWIYQQRNYWNEAEKYFRKSLRLAEEVKDRYVASEAYHGIGAIAERTGDFEKAIEQYSISLNFAEKNQDYINLAKAHNAFGRIYHQQGDYSKALKHKEKSIHIFERLKDLPELAKAYTSLGLTYNDMDDMEKNIEFNEKCIELAERISDIRIKGYGLSNAVDALVNTNQLDKALKYTSEALRIFKKLEERYMIALNYVNFGIIFKHKGNWDEATYYFKTAIEFMENLNIPFHLAICYREFADVHRRKGETIKTRYYLEKAKEIYQSISATSFIDQVDEELKDMKIP